MAFSHAGTAEPVTDGAYSHASVGVDHYAPIYQEPVAQTPMRHESVRNYERTGFRAERPSYVHGNTAGGQKKGLAIFAMISGIFAMPPISLVSLAIVIGILVAIFGNLGLVISGIIALALFPMGLITGIVSLVRANRKPHEYGGKGFSIAGIVLSSFALVTVPVVAAIAIPNLLAARRAANEGSAIATLRKIKEMQSDFIALNGKCGEINMLNWDKDPKNPTLNVKSGYQFVIAHTPTAGCEIIATPTVTQGVSATGNRTFSMSSEEGWTIMASKDGEKRPIGEPVDLRPQRADTRSPGRRSE